MLKMIIRNEQNIDIDFENTIIFFDEVQESEEIISSLKYFNESEIPYKIICAGSLLGVKLKRMEKAFPVGKVDMINMNPMDFEEFLTEIMGQDIIKTLKEHYKANTPIVDVMHNELLSLYRLYLCVGGMPGIVLDQMLDHVGVGQGCGELFIQLGAAAVCLHEIGQGVGQQVVGKLGRASVIQDMAEC